MKSPVTLLIFAILFFLSCKDEEIIFTSECYPEELRNGVIASYSFQNGSLEDGSSNRADVDDQISGIPASDRNGNASCAYSFNRNHYEHLSTTNTSFLNNLDVFSISLWYQSTDSSGHGGLEILISRDDSHDQCSVHKKGEWSLGLETCKRAVFGHNNLVLTNFPLAIPPASCQDNITFQVNKWHHVVAIYNRNNYKIYLNGILHNSASGVSDCPDLHLTEDQGDLIIGKGHTGKIDDILIYNREVSADEVTDLYNLQPCCN
jgi:hypothetical protein